MNKRIVTALLALAVLVTVVPQVQAQYGGHRHYGGCGHHSGYDYRPLLEYVNQPYGLGLPLVDLNNLGYYGYGQRGYYGGHRHHSRCGHSWSGYYGYGRHPMDGLVDRLLYGPSDQVSENQLVSDCSRGVEDSCVELAARDSKKYERVMKARRQHESATSPESEYEREEVQQPAPVVRTEPAPIPVAPQPAPVARVVIENLSGLPAKVFAEVDNRTIKLAPEQTLPNRLVPRRKGLVRNDSGNWVATEVELDTKSGHYLIMPPRKERS